MGRAIVFLAATFVAVARASAAQSIPTTVVAAEAEGASFPLRATPTTVASVFAAPFGGTSERKCAAPPSADSPPGGSLRSGDFIIRSSVFGPDRRALLTHKILWLPLHNPIDYPSTLLVRATLIGQPADSLRLSFPDAAYPSGERKSDSGFPSAVRFLAAGQWLVVATAGADWGCFLLTVGG